MESRDDRELIAAVLGGNADAFAGLLHRHGDSCMRFAVRMLGSKEDADDALQSAFLRAYRGLQQCRDPERFKPWLLQIVVNECRTYATRRSRREQRFVHDETRLGRATAPSTHESADLREELHLALAQLPVEQREAFILKYADDLSYEEMAAMTGVGVSALKMRVKRACDRLRELMDGVLQ